MELPPLSSSDEVTIGIMNIAAIIPIAINPIYNRIFFMDPPDDPDASGRDGGGVEPPEFVGVGAPDATS